MTNRADFGLTRNGHQICLLAWPTVSFIAILLLLLAALAHAQSPVRKLGPGAQQTPNIKPTTPAPGSKAAATPPPASTPAAQPATTRPPLPQLSAAQTLQKLLRAPRTMGPKVPNPRAAGRVLNQTNTIAMLKKQMQAGTAERAQIMAAPHSVSQISTAGSTQASAWPPAGPSRPYGSTPSNSISASSLPPSGPRNRPQVQSETQAMFAACQQGKITIFDINGAAPQAIVFTPDPQYNLYTIQGCNFGAPQGQLSLVGHFKNFTISLTVVDWTDTAIIAGMDPNLSGELDQNKNVTLLLTRADSQRLETSGASFYAVRQSVRLATIPQPWATLGTVRDVNGADLTPGYQTGTADTSSATVSRFSTDRFSGGQDYFDFSRLNSQFSLDSMQLEYATGQDTCASTNYGGQNTIYIDGYPSVQWDGDGIRVYLGGITCHNSDTGDRAYSVYTLQVQVTGPRGVDPTQQ